MRVRSAEAARRKWGETDAWQQSSRRTAVYAKDDWFAIKAEADENIQRFAAAIEAGEPADVAMDQAEAHRLHVDRWFYERGRKRHRGLAHIYISDPRYGHAWDDVAPGFSRYAHDAIHANAERSA